MGSRISPLWEASYIKATNHLMPSGIIQRQKIRSSKACLEATGICHLWQGDDSPALEKKTTGEIISSTQMNLGIEPSNVPLNTSLLCTHGIKAAARADTGHVCSSVTASCAKKHKSFAPCLALSSVSPSQSTHRTVLEDVPGSKGSCSVYVGSCGPTYGRNHSSTVPEAALTACSMEDRQG